MRLPLSSHGNDARIMTQANPTSEIRKAEFHCGNSSHCVQLNIHHVKALSVLKLGKVGNASALRGMFLWL